MALIIIIYITASLIYFGYFSRRNKEEGLFRLSVILFLPILGYLLFLLLRLINTYGKKYCSIDNKANELPERTSAEWSFKSIDVSRALNLVPMEEALLVNENSIKRTMLLDLLKDDMMKYTPLLKIALSCEDTETSHYAAVGIVEVNRKLQHSVQESKLRYEKKGDKDTLVSYAYALKAYLDSGLLDEANHKNTMTIYKDILRKTLEVYDGEEVFFEDIINYEISAGNFGTAKAYCERFLNTHRQSEKPYLMYLKLFYATRDRKGFDNALNLLKNSAVSLSCNTWNIVKFWMGAN